MADGAGSFIKFAVTALKSEYMTLGISGVAGAIAASMVEWRGWSELIRKMIVGGLCAAYLSPLAVPMLRFFLSGLPVDADTLAPRVGAFLMGIFGIVFVEFLLKLFRVRKDMLQKQADVAASSATQSDAPTSYQQTSDDHAGE